jgi:hypothetical protein
MAGKIATITNPEKVAEVSKRAFEILDKDKIGYIKISDLQTGLSQVVAEFGLPAVDDFDITGEVIIRADFNDSTEITLENFTEFIDECMMIYTEFIDEDITD